MVASAWASTPSDPVKQAIGDVLDSWGWRPPAWYETMKAEVQPISGDPRSLGNAADQAGLVDVHATAVAEDLGLRDPAIVVAYRLAMPQIAPWVARLGEPAASELVRELCVAVVPHVPRWRPSVIQLTARVPLSPGSGLRRDPMLLCGHLLAGAGNAPCGRPNFPIRELRTPETLRQ